MPSRTFTKKGKLNAAARQALNATASSRILEKTAMGKNEDTCFARITKMLGMGHAVVRISSGDSTKELPVRIPPKFGRRGATPITLNSVVSIFVGKDYDPLVKSLNTEHFDIIAIFTDRQARDMVLGDTIPSWMLRSVDEISSGIKVAIVEDEGFEWDATPEGEDALTGSQALTKAQLREAKKTAGKAILEAHRSKVDEDDFDVDDI